MNHFCPCWELPANKYRTLLSASNGLTIVKPNGDLTAIFPFSFFTLRETFEALCSTKRPITSLPCTLCGLNLAFVAKIRFDP